MQTETEFCATAHGCNLRVGMARRASSARSGALLFLGSELELVGHPAQRRQRARLHLPHHAATVHFYRRFGDADIVRNLLADAAARDRNRNLALWGARPRETLAYCSKRCKPGRNGALIC